MKTLMRNYRAVIKRANTSEELLLKKMKSINLDVRDLFSGSRPR